MHSRWSCSRQVRHTASSETSIDIWTLQVVSGMQPYHHLPTEYAVFLHIVRGGRPTRAHLDNKTVTNDMWRFLTSLWNREPSTRPEMSEVMQSLTLLYVSLNDFAQISYHYRRDQDLRDEESSPELFLDSEVRMHILVQIISNGVSLVSRIQWHPRK